MQHLTDSEIIRIVAHELPAADADVVRAHVETCPACRARLAEQERTWTTLGAWVLDEGATAVVETVFARLDEESGRRILEKAGSRFGRARWAWAGRLAASVLIGVGTGHAIGRWTSGREGAETTGSEPVASAEAIDSLGLDVFASAPVGLEDIFESGPDEVRPDGGQS